MLFICICVVYHYFIKQLDEVEYRISKLEHRIENYKREYKQHFKNIKGIVIPIKEIENYDINKVIKWLSEYNKKKVKK